jgi:cell division protein FtsB
MHFKDLFKSKFVTVMLMICFSAVAYITGDLYMQKVQVDSEIAKLDQQARELSDSNDSLSELIKYMNTQEYKEKEAREKLNLKRPGEQVVVLPSPDDGKVIGANTDTEQLSNPRKWLNYFFN